MVYSKLASAIENDIISGLRGYNANPSISIEQIEDEIVEERLTIMKEYSLKGILPKHDLLVSINCIDLDCESMDRCPCNKSAVDELKVKHFKIPQTMGDFGMDAINYIGSTDRTQSYLIYTSPNFQKLHNSRKRGKDKPYVYIDLTPTYDGYIDGFIFNAPMLKQISAVMIPKDVRQLELYSCCDFEEINDVKSFLNTEIKKRIIEKKIRYYRQFQAQLLPNDQTPK